MALSLTRREIKSIMGWRRQALWPDEERVLRKLRRALEAGEPPRLSRLQVRIVYGWGEEQTGGHYGATIQTADEKAIMDKLRAVLEGEAGV